MAQGPPPTPRQRPLIPLTAEEKALREGILARLYLELEEMQADHADAKKEMKADEDELKRQMRKVARSIRDGREPEQP